MAPQSNALTAVWAALMLATCASTWWLSKDGVSAQTATVLVMLIAAVKARLILIHFMELQHAPASWRWLFDGWTAGCTAIIVAAYLG